MKSSENSLLSSNSLQSFKQINRKTSETLQFNFLLSCSIASVTSYLSENEAENLQNGNVHLAPFGTLRSVMARLLVFFTLFHSSATFFDWNFPVIKINSLDFKQSVVAP